MKLFTIYFGLYAMAYGQVPNLDGRIVGGMAVDISDFPYQVSVRYYDTHICGGTIIDSKTILTAAHCVYGLDHTQYNIRVGNTKHALGRSYKVQHIIPHENYNHTIIENDIAILKLERNLIFNFKCLPILLQNKGEMVTAGTNAWVSGWGVTAEGINVVSSSLRAVNVAVITNRECLKKYGHGITPNMICAQTLYKDSCQGDSGGPLVANEKLIGIISWGYGCARPQYPGVYTKISNMYDWIQNNRI